MKKIAVNTVKNFLEEARENHEIVRRFPIGDSEFEVTIKTRLTTEEKSMFISRVLSGCFDAKQAFRPEYLQPMIHATVLQMCTNLPVISLKRDRGENGESLMDIDAMEELYCTLGFEVIDDAGYQIMLKDITMHVRAAVEWRQRVELAAMGSEGSRAIREMANTFSKFITSIDAGKLMEYAAKLSQNTEGLDGANLIRAILAANEGAES